MDNEINGQDQSGIWISSGSTPTLRTNEIEYNRGPGIEIMDEGTALIVGNTIERNEFGGVTISIGATATLRSNKITENFDAAITIRLDAGGIFEGNDLRGNEFGPTTDTKAPSQSVKAQAKWSAATILNRPCRISRLTPRSTIPCVRSEVLR